MVKIIIGIVLTLIVLVIGISWFLAPDNLMDCDKAPSEKTGCQAADVIIAVSGGDTKARTAEAISLYKNGWASHLIFSGAALDTSGPSNAAVMREQALASGVPDEAITIEQQSQTTEQNAAKTSTILFNKEIRSAIVVTSAYHMKRAILEFEREAPSINFRAHPVESDDQWSAWWWLTPYGWFLAISELIKIAAVKMGLGQ